MNSGTIAGLTSAPLKTKGWNFVKKSLTLSSGVNEILGSVDQDIKIITPSYTSITSKSITISTGDTVNSGDIAFQAGSSSSIGGTIKLYAGCGPYNYPRAAGTGAWGAHITLNGNSGWAAGSAFINGGQAGNFGGPAGNITLTSGSVQIYDSTPGYISLITSPGGAGLANGGALTNTTGSGSSNAIANAVGWTGGAYTITTGAGGAGTATTGTTTGGAGGAITLTSGAGGAATSATTSTKTGGNSGPISLTTGAGGNGTNVNGNSGSITIATGIPGAGAGSAGVSGSILFTTGSTNQITIAAATATTQARTTITSETKIERAYIQGANSNTTITLVAADAGSIIRCTAATNITINLPAVAMAVGYNVTVIQEGTGTITFVNSATNTFYSYAGLATTAGQYATASLVCNVAGSLILYGNLA